MKKSEDLRGYPGVAKGETRWSLTQMGENQLKRNAAQKGCQFIVITSNTRDNLKAIAYTY